MTTSIVKQQMVSYQNKEKKKGEYLTVTKQDLWLLKHDRQTDGHNNA